MNPLRSFLIRSILQDFCVFPTLRFALTLAVLGTAAALPAQEPKSAAQGGAVGDVKLPQQAARVSRSGTINDRYVYTIDFPGGPVASFAQFWKTNGFAGDNILMVGPVDRVYLPKFTINSAHLSEIGKSIEFVSEKRVRIEIAEGDMGGANIWRISASLDEASEQVKVRACPAPSFLSRPDGSERMERLLSETNEIWMEQIRERKGPSRNPGMFRILQRERIVVAAGSQDYVDAVASVIEAAEKAIARPPL